MEGKQLPLDRITTLPQCIIDIILCLLPIEEATRTSILSREWRYKWTKIPKLFFSEPMVITTNKEKKLSKESSHISARRNMDSTCKFFYNILQVLLLRQSPIHEFTLSMHADSAFSEIDQIILHLSRNHTVKKLRLSFVQPDTNSKKLRYSFAQPDTYSLPFSFFSLHHLTDLNLEYCDLNHTPIFDGFRSLTSLTLSRVKNTKENLLHLLSNCPSLKSVWLLVPYENVKAPSIMELFKCLPVIESLNTCGEFILFLVRYSTPDPEELPISLIHLKYCCIEDMEFRDIDIFTFLVDLIKCAPNLEKIKLEIGSSDMYDMGSFKLEHYFDILEGYSDLWLEHLNELKVEHFGNLKPELEFVKFILARSPNMKKVILTTYIDDHVEELELLRTLLCAPRVSPVEIIVENLRKRKRRW